MCRNKSTLCALVVKKLRAARGESLAEALASVLIIVLAGLMLAGSVMASGRVNARVRETKVFGSFDGAAVTQVTARISGTGEDTVIECTMYTDEESGGLRFYEMDS